MHRAHFLDIQNICGKDLYYLITEVPALRTQGGCIGSADEGPRGVHHLYRLAELSLFLPVQSEIISLFSVSEMFFTDFFTMSIDIPSALSKRLTFISSPENVISVLSLSPPAYRTLCELLPQLLFQISQAHLRQWCKAPCCSGRKA